jgi:hypothetical protein
MGMYNPENLGSRGSDKERKMPVEEKQEFNVHEALKENMWHGLVSDSRPDIHAQLRWKDRVGYDDLFRNSGRFEEFLDNASRHRRLRVSIEENGNYYYRFEPSIEAKFAPVRFRNKQEEDDYYSQHQDFAVHKSPLHDGILDFMTDKLGHGFLQMALARVLYMGGESDTIAVIDGIRIPRHTRKQDVAQIFQMLRDSGIDIEMTIEDYPSGEKEKKNEQKNYPTNPFTRKHTEPEAAVEKPRARAAHLATRGVYAYSFDKLLDRKLAKKIKQYVDEKLPNIFLDDYATIYIPEKHDKGAVEKFFDFLMANDLDIEMTNEDYVETHGRAKAHRVQDSSGTRPFYTYQFDYPIDLGENAKRYIEDNVTEAFCGWYGDSLNLPKSLDKSKVKKILNMLKDQGADIELTDEVYG